VLVIAALICQVLADAADMGGLPGAMARSGVPLAAILFPADFFFSSMGRDRTRPNRLVWLAGAVVLGASVITLGVGLLT
jgi:hypothetical protein